MPASINDWYANRADQSNGHGDDELVERQAAWDTRRADRPLGKRAESRKQQASTRPSKVAAPLTAEQRRLKPLVTAMRHRYPGVSYKRLSEMLRLDGVWVSRKQIAIILAPPVRETRASGTSRRTTAARPGHATSASASNPLRAESERFGKLVAEAERAAKKILAEDKKAKAAVKDVTPKKKASKQSTKAAAKRGAKTPSDYPSQRELREARTRHHRRSISVAKVAPGPRASAPTRLVLDEPRRRPVRTEGWTRAKDAGPSALRGHSGADVPVPCYACGVVPTQFGSCRCT